MARTVPPGRDRGAVRHPAAPGAARLTEARHVVVVGGGIAGLASAAVLAERGVQVTLVEACEQLGGRVRAWSLGDGRTMSRGFHAFFRQYYTLRSLLRRADPTLSRLVPVPDYPLRRGDGLTDSFAALPVTPPANLAAFVLRSPTFPVSALPAVHLPSALELIDVSYPASHERYDGESAQDFLDRLRFPDGARHLALEVFARSFFAHPSEFGAGELVGMFHTYFTGSSEGLLFDVPDDDYDTALWAPLGRYLTGLGVDVRLGERVGSLTQDEDGVWLVRTEPGPRTEPGEGDGGGEDVLLADAVVLATDPRATRSLTADLSAKNSAQQDWHRRAQAGSNAPPFAVLRLWLDGKVTPDREAFLGTSGYDILDNVTVLERFEDGAASWADEHGGSVVELHAYAADPTRDADLAGDSPHGLNLRRLRERLMTAMHNVYPETAGLGVVHEELLVDDDCGLVGTGPWRERLTVDTPYPGLVLAGDGLRVDWPIALMERAAVTGVLAANQLLAGWGVRGEDIWTVPLEGILRRPRSAVARLGRAVRGRIPVWSGAGRRVAQAPQAIQPGR
ncbi:FAD-dependent oxidoreductase [Ornithinimicrobium pratense]|uniref:FAD-dependent oxidoreductase n=1 Tax=Ornithinimicrobium pratense TaxID=2593973 RepID=A0A5J6V2K2_9MICO|nr:FAD-dependent oxidoreductase [Ornithinimicrobium pratense]QFG67381.1 FAD-dependent oxidoreductase [Ornithinimicrobium pratense]